jgi:hypothetical protein
MSEDFLFGNEFAAMNSQMHDWDDIHESKLLEQKYRNYCPKNTIQNRNPNKEDATSGLAAVG